MLIELTIKNLAIIHEAKLCFGPGFNVITGETGAGKSLLIDALEFALGRNSARDLMRNQTASTSVEAVFSITSTKLLEILDLEFGLDCHDDQLLVVNRKLHTDGKAITKVNGSTVTTKTLKAIADILVDIHSQGTHLSLAKSSRQLEILDSYKNLHTEKKHFESLLQNALTLKQELNSITETIQQNTDKADLHSFQLKEIDEANLTLNEEAVLTEERELLYHASKISNSLETAYMTLQEQDGNAIDLLGHALLSLQKSPDPSGFIAPRLEVLLDFTEQLKEISRDLKSFKESVDTNDTRLSQINERIELIKTLKRKYGPTEDHILTYANQIREYINQNENLLKSKYQLSLSLEKAWEEAGMAASALSANRLQAAKSLEKSTQSELTEVGLAYSSFEVKIRHTPSAEGIPTPEGNKLAFNSNGVDSVEFLLSTNPGELHKPLAKIASGGETSRAMLAISSALQSHTAHNTLIFDEIDTGIGGRIGEVVGKKLWSSSINAQVLCITHLPQIAAFADKHFKVQKTMNNARTYTHAIELNPEGKISELAEMMGNHKSNNLLHAATELLSSAAEIKKS